MKKSSIRLLVRSYTFSERRVKNQQPKQLKSVEHGLAYFQLATTVLHFQIVFTCYWDYRLVSVWMLLWLRLKGKNSLEIGFHIIITIAIYTLSSWMDVSSYMCYILYIILYSIHTSTQSVFNPIIRKTFFSTPLAKQL